MDNIIDKKEEGGSGEGEKIPRVDLKRRSSSPEELPDTKKKSPNPTLETLWEKFDRIREQVGKLEEKQRKELLTDSSSSQEGGGGERGEDICGKCSLAVEKRCLEIDKRFLAMEKRFVEIEKLAMTTEVRSAQMPGMAKGQEEISRRLFYIAMDVEKLRVAVQGLGGNVQPLFTQTLGQSQLSGQNQNPRSQSQGTQSDSKSRSSGSGVVPEKSKSVGGNAAASSGKDENAALKTANAGVKTVPAGASAAAGKEKEQEQNEKIRQQEKSENKIKMPKDQLKNSTSNSNVQKNSTNSEKKKGKSTGIDEAELTKAENRTMPQLMYKKPKPSTASKHGQNRMLLQSKIRAASIPIPKLTGISMSSSKKFEEKKGRKSFAPKKIVLEKDINIKQEPVWNCKISDFEFEQMDQQQGALPIIDVPDYSKLANNPGKSGQNAGISLSKPVMILPAASSVSQGGKDAKILAGNKSIVPSEAEELQIELARKRYEVIQQWKINATKSSQEIRIESGKQEQEHPLDFSKGRNETSQDRSPQGTYHQIIGKTRPEVGLPSFDISFRKELENKLQKSKDILAKDQKFNRRSNGKTGRPKLDDPRERSYVCNFCGNKYLSKTGLFDHFKRGHEIAASLHYSILDGTLKHGAGAIIKHHQCMHCGEKFTGSQALAYHKMYRKCHSRGYSYTAYPKPSNVNVSKRPNQPTTEQAGPSTNAIRVNGSNSNDLHKSVQFMKDCMLPKPQQ